ncbi:TetR/AcrR family transcriptional regulator [Streptomyces sp. NPDC091217]|uniref:TetR/AcrR family transcriptional regulator n=1 Tax=Streptomyces sp. NPDC091217 TaxID=3365975 RepID=UPI003804E3F1
MTAKPDTAQRRGYHHGDLPATLKSAAVDMVGELGSVEFSLAALARRVGVSSGAPYQHFPDREALLTAIAIDGYAALRAAFADAVASPDGGLPAVAAAYVQFARARPALFAVMCHQSLEGDLSEELSAAMDQTVAAVRSAAAAVAEPADVARLALATIGLAQGFAQLATGPGARMLGDGAEDVAVMARRATAHLARHPADW